MERRKLGAGGLEASASKILIQGARYPEHVERMTGR